MSDLAQLQSGFLAFSPLARGVLQEPPVAAGFDRQTFLDRLEGIRRDVQTTERFEAVLTALETGETPDAGELTSLAALDVDIPQSAAAVTPTVLSATAPAAQTDASDDAGGPAVDALGGGFWARFLTSVERTVDSIGATTDFIGTILEQPWITERIESFMENVLNLLDSILERLDNLLDIVDRWAPPSFDGWIEDIQDRIAEERDDIDAILNPPAPVADVPADEPPAPDAPDGPQEDEDTTEWSASDFTGDGKTVVVIDSGWNTEFLGEDERPVDQFDFYSNDGNAQVGHSNDHGSWVDQVIRTVADGVQMIHLKVFPDTSGGAPLSVIDRALDWVIDAVRNEDYDISAVNLSLGYGNTTQEMATGLSDEFAALDDLGVFSVVAAGNSGANGVQYLAADENTIAVSASTSSSNIAGFSQHHSELTDIFALGQSVRIENEFGGSNSVSGTSFAAPYISGIAARLQEAADELIERSLTDEEFIEILQVSGNDLNGYAGSTDPAGYHIADADAAVTYFIDNYNDYI